jgi:hypothetical protein
MGMTQPRKCVRPSPGPGERGLSAGKCRFFSLHGYEHLPREQSSSLSNLFIDGTATTSIRSA